MKLLLAPKNIPMLATMAVLLTLYVLGCVSYRNFASLRVFVNLLGDNAFLGVAAIGATFVILSGGIDLSVGAVVAFTSILVAVLVERSGVSPLLAMTFALLLGAAFGAAMGALIEVFQLPPFLVTLGGMFFARGMAFVITPQSLGLKNSFYTETVQSLALPLTKGVQLSLVALCCILLFVLAHCLATSTRFGRAVYAIGGDEQSATLMGLPVARTKILVYTLAGFCSAAAGVLYALYTQSGDPAATVGFELDAIAAVVIGGTLLTGGVGSLLGTAMGVLILGLIQTLISFQGNLNTWWTRIAVGVLVLAFVLLQKVLSGLSKRAKPLASVRKT